MAKLMKRLNAVAKKVMVTTKGFANGAITVSYHQVDVKDLKDLQYIVESLIDIYRLIYDDMRGDDLHDDLCELLRDVKTERVKTCTEVEGIRALAAKYKCDVCAMNHYCTAV